MSGWRGISTGRLFIIAAVVLAGCSSGSSVRRPGREVSWQEIHAVVDRQRDRIQRLAGSGRIALETPDLAQSGSFRLSVQKPDSVLLRIEGPFGIRVGSILLTRDSIKFYSALENRMFLGSSRPENLRRILRVDITTEDLIGLLSGGAFLAEDRGVPDSVTTSPDEVILWYSSGELMRRYAVDNASLFLRRIQFLDRRGKVQLEHVFTEFRATDGMEAPFMLRTIRPKERQMLSLRYSDLILNPPQADLTFRVPASAEVIRWTD